ncbi:ABC transporter [alpha proteobacterium AAP81b]|nr:ABC transporter [alpha proteobacterium AAP81b]
MSAAAGVSVTLRGARVQTRVIGALMMRELHTRYGRDNIGYLWIFAEPMLLAVAVATLHAGQHIRSLGGLRPVPFVLVGYGLFIAFRSILSRAESLIEANRPLLHHRRVTLFDMLVARALLEAAGTLLALALLLAAAIALDLADPPARPGVLLAAASLMLWFSFALSMLVAAAAQRSQLFARLLHPALYLSLPLSGAFFVLAWLPGPIRDLLAPVPLVQIFELARHGMFAAASDVMVDLPAILAWCLGLTLAGMLSLRAVRRHIELS